MHKHNELIIRHERVEELITDAIEYMREMSVIASELYGETVNVSIDDDGDIWFRAQDGVYLTITDILRDDDNV